MQNIYASSIFADRDILWDYILAQDDTLIYTYSC